MTDDPTSGNRWEPARDTRTPFPEMPASDTTAFGEGAPSAAVPSPDTAAQTPAQPAVRRRLTGARAKLTAAAAVLFLGGGAAGYAVAQTASDDGTGTGSGTTLPNPSGFGHDGDDHDHGFGDDPGEGLGDGAPQGTTPQEGAPPGGGGATSGTVYKIDPASPSRSGSGAGAS